MNKKYFVILCYIVVALMIWILNYIHSINTTMKSIDNSYKQLLEQAIETKKTCNRDYNKLLKINKEIWA